ncbi:hypothetical protein EXN66_Car002253 [Channa argus]|uniref:Uncharacterized protein n=1 Tax=Channa argus TaxID=215402 RepID=A0A6G1P8G6_CHAAH|nr:hypothetical protein EXN66_Car002253 [Channa argus]
MTRTRLPLGLSSQDIQYCFAHILHTPSYLSNDKAREEGNTKKVGLCVGHKAPSSVTNDQNTKVNTPLVI